jgi:hypothetical protein
VSAHHALYVPIILDFSVLNVNDSSLEGHLDVGDGHSLAYDVSGNPDGVPCVFLVVA